MQTFFLFITQFYGVCMEYIYYKTINRQCLPFFNCGPGNEILPCAENFQQDICIPCPSSLVQPDLISSSEDGDFIKTTCFKPVSECYSQDITYRRIPKKAFCDSLKGCKCDTTNCHYGDPCLCEEKRDKCEVNETMDDNGKCVPCTEGTMKDHKGCGPCRKIPNMTKTPVSLNLVQSSSSPQKSSLQASTLLTMLNSSIRPQTPRIRNDSHGLNDDLIMIFLVVLGVLALLLSLVVFVICMKRTGFVFTGVCWTQHLQRNEADVNKQNEEQNIPILPIVDDKVHHQTHTGNATSQPSDEKCKCQRLYPNLPDEKQSETQSSGRSPCESVCYMPETSNDKSRETMLQDDTLSSGLSDKSSLSTHPLKKEDNGEEKWENYDDDQKMKEFRHKLEKSARYLNQKNLQISNSCNPVVLETEPHVLPDILTDESMASGSYISMYAGSSNRRTSGYQTELNNDTFGTTPVSTESCMAVSESVSNMTERIRSTLENYEYCLKGVSCYDNQTPSTVSKYGGQNKLDNGFSVTNG